MQKYEKVFISSNFYEEKLLISEKVHRIYLYVHHFSNFLTFIAVFRTSVLANSCLALLDKVFHTIGFIDTVIHDVVNGPVHARFCLSLQ